MEMPTHKPRQWHGTQLTWVLLLGCIALFLSACPARALLSHKQLGGADPNNDLAATPQLKQLQKRKVTVVSVRGVKLLDPLSRVYSMWGKPKGSKEKRYIWTDPKGTYKLRVLVGRQMLETAGPDGKRFKIVVRQIDIFSTYLGALHPNNRPLLDPKLIRSSSWRSQTFGTQGTQKQSHLREWFTFPKRGYRFMIISRLLPLHKKVTSVFSLFIPEEDLTQLRIIPLS